MQEINQRKQQSGGMHIERPPPKPFSPNERRMFTLIFTICILTLIVELIMFLTMLTSYYTIYKELIPIISNCMNNALKVSG